MIQEKYIELLLKRCLRVEESNALFINYNKINKDFVDKIVDYAKNLGIDDIYLDEDDSNYIHDILKDIKLEEVEKHEEFDCKVWDEYAEKGAVFLMLDTEIPNLMDDIDSDILTKMAFTKRKSKPIYSEKQKKSEIGWCIAAVPNIYWAKDIFAASDTPLEDFWQVLAEMCILDKEVPIKEWDNLLNERFAIIEKLNNLEIKKLHYTNSLGTDLTVELCDNATWQSSSTEDWIVNMPSYEIFTIPDYRKTEGIVYSSRPLIYNGTLIDEFSLTFKDGKVVEFDAKEGKDVLEEIIKGDELSAYLGEAALVNYNSPISNTNKVFKSTLFDENASCHLALGSGYIECIKDAEAKSEEELKELGVNNSKNHVDFMVGTEDLVIEAETKDGTITIMENGDLVI